MYENLEETVNILVKETKKKSLKNGWIIRDARKEEWYRNKIQI